MRSRDCRAVVEIDGVRYHCDLNAPHAGLAHSNLDARTVWVSDGEARAAERKATFANRTPPRKENE